MDIAAPVKRTSSTAPWLVPAVPWTAEEISDSRSAKRPMSSEVEKEVKKERLTTIRRLVDGFERFFSSDLTKGSIF